MTGRATTVLIVLAALAAGGCGVADDRDQAAATVERFYDAVRADDGETACGLLTAAAREQLESQSGQACAAVVTRLEHDGGAVVRSEVFVTNARVVLQGQESAFLGREPAGWRISALACTSPDGKPESRPMDCEVAA